MGRASGLRKKDKTVLEAVHRLFDAGHTLDEVLDHLRGLGVEDVSRSALGRERKRHEEAVAEVRRHQDLADRLVKEFGQDSSHKAMRANLQLMQALISRFSDVLAGRHEDDVDIQDIARLCQSLAALGRAAKTDTEVLARLKEEARKEVAEEAASAARDAGVSESAISMIMGRISAARNDKELS